MIPEITELEFEEEENLPSKTYRIDFDNGRISGFTDEIEAVKQAIVLILNTDRFRHLIYSWDYGSELKNVIGEDFDIAESEAKRYITEALTQDDRITAVSDFIFTKMTEKQTARISFTVETIYGTASGEVVI